MEPRLSSRAKPWARDQAQSLSRCRNGARLLWPGETCRILAIGNPDDPPQWSPALVAGVRSVVTTGSSLSPASRNAARPLSPGETGPQGRLLWPGETLTAAGRYGCRCRCRNGARPLWPGKPVNADQVAGVTFEAAM